MMPIERPIIARRPLSFSTGPMWPVIFDHNKRLEFLRSLDLRLDGVEICLPYSDQVLEFTPTPANVEWMRSLTTVSIHAPFRMETDSLLEQMDKICGLYREIKAFNVIIHPNTLPEPGILAKHPDVRFSTENLPPNGNISRQGLGKILQRYTNLGLCLDVTHAFHWSADETGNLTHEFRDRLTQIHLSGGKKTLEHLPIQEASLRYMDSIRCLFNLDIPIVMEFDYGNADNIDLQKKIIEDVSHVQRLFQYPRPVSRMRLLLEYLRMQ